MKIVTTRVELAQGGPQAFRIWRSTSVLAWPDPKRCTQHKWCYEFIPTQQAGFVCLTEWYSDEMAPILKGYVIWRPAALSITWPTKLSVEAMMLSSKAGREWYQQDSERWEHLRPKHVIPW